jgi:NAD(P)H dehydrogenase (quinone)
VSTVTGAIVVTGPIVVTGATGKLGRLVIEALIRRGIDPSQIVAAGRSAERLDELASRGLRVAKIDYADPESLRSAFAGADQVLLVSGPELGQRVRLHGNAIDAARSAGVGRLAYTSIAHAESSSLLLAQEHRGTEELLAASGLPYVLLRNSWYVELYTEPLATTLANGVIVGSAGDGEVSAATRADYAEAAAAVLAAGGRESATYELGGDEAFTLPEVAAEITVQSGTTVAYKDLPTADYQQALVGFGLPAELAAVLADADRGLAAGDLRVDTGDLSRLIGRPTTTLAEAVAVGLKALRA